MSKTIAVIGLGLIGGSMALALKCFEDFEIVGVDVSEPTLRFAAEHSVGDRVTAEAGEVIPQADVTILCLHPRGITRFLEEYKNQFKPGSLVTDVCGIKTAIMEAAEVLPPEVDFIGCHPMAGTEFSGIEHSFPELFQRCHFILTPRAESAPAHVALMERIADYIGAADVVQTTPERHDQIIAYTSQLMHIIALSVCDDAELFQCKGFEGGSFRDCTRVAALDVPLWKELMTLNADALTQVIIRLEENIHAYRVALEHHDVERVTAKLEYSSNRKRRMNLPGPGQVSLDLDLFQ